jgi:hypothetical protein
MVLGDSWLESEADFGRNDKDFSNLDHIGRSSIKLEKTMIF